MATSGDRRPRITPPRTSIPRYADSLNERLCPAALSFMLHALVIALLLWKSAPLVSDFMQGQLGGGGGGGNDGSETQLISLSVPVQSVAVAPVVPTPPVAVTPTPDPVPQPKIDTVTTSVTTAISPLTQITTTAVSGDVGAAALGAGGGAGGGSGTGNGPGNGVGNGPGSGPGSGNGTGGGGNSLDGLIPPSPIGLNLPPMAPKALKGKLITVLITVDPEGHVLDAQLDKSTGDNKYDKTLRSSAMSWRLRPARTRTGEAVKSTMPVTYLL